MVEWSVEICLFLLPSIGLLTNGEDKSAVLESPWIAASAIYQKIGICLTFSYLLPTYYGSSLTVFLMTTSNLSLWSLSGHQGNTWLTGQVSFTTNEDFKVMESNSRLIIYRIWNTMPHHLSILTEKRFQLNEVLDSLYNSI